MADRAGKTAIIRAEVEGNLLQLLAGGRERLEALVRLIDEAQVDLRLLYYMFSGDVAGKTVRNALVRAAKRGVAVNLLVDGFGCGSTEPGFLDELKEAGGHFCIFHSSYGRRYLIRNHQKMAIADSKRALVGGANINLQYLVDDDEDRWRDLWLSVDGPAIVDLAKYFDAIEGWTRRRKPQDPRPSPDHHQPQSRQGQGQLAL